MFALIGRLAARYRWAIVAAWIVAAVFITLVAPNIDDVAVNDQRAFLQAEAPSIEAAETVEEYFPERTSPSSAAIVFRASEVGDASASGESGGGSLLEGETGAFIGQITEWLRGPDAPKVVERVTSPIGPDQQTAAALVAEDGRVALISVAFSSIGTEEVTLEAVEQIGERLDAAPASLNTYITGDAAIIGAYDQATRESLDSTTWITIMLVILILLAVYRSPISPLIPLGTIALAYLISRGFIAFLGDGIITISGYTNIFLIVILFGAGTDYCLFLISRFREEMAKTEAPRPAATETVRTVGETIASSAGTVIVGLSTMAFAKLGLFNTTGPSVAIGVFITLIAGLTLTPALLALLGDRAFWPRRSAGVGESRIWHWWSTQVTDHPWIALGVGLTLLLPLALYGEGQHRTFDLLADLPEDMEAREGFGVLSDSLGAGTMQPLTLVLVAEDSMTDPSRLKMQNQLVQRVQGLEHVREVRSFTGSLDQDTLQVSGQLEDQLAGVQQAQQQLADLGPLAALAPSDMIQEAAGALLDLRAYLSQLGEAYPEVQDDPGYRKANDALQQLFSAVQQGSLSSLPEGPAALLGDLTDGLEGLQERFQDREGAIMLPDTYVKNNEGLRQLREAYFSTDARAARLQVVLDSGPYTEEALSTVVSLRDLMQNETSLDGYVEGASAVVADLQTASAGDMVRSIVFVLIGVFVVLVLLLRALVAPVYLILTILVSYGATLGIVRLVFSDLLGTGGVTWWVPIFMFVMLVALGMDYNIFLMGRVKEEVQRHGNHEGTRLAVAKTGGIITSAGIIMAGTFAAMMSGQITGLVQIGFAVSLGVLLDTFVVRTALVPAIAVLLGDWNWWPKRPEASD
ncbi:MAG TPA: MMPL family transporter [Thermoleophilia bacterium]|nr:MMPL family transporter [Thermoleophilia bacterium]